MSSSINEFTPHSSKVSFKNLLLVFGVALVLRIGTSVYWQVNQLDNMLPSDPYVVLAQTLLGWIQNAPEIEIQRVPPGFSFVIAGVFSLLDSPDYLAIRILNAFFSSAACFLLAVWALPWAGRRASELAGLFLALSPTAIVFSATLQSESFYLFLSMLFFVVVCQSWSELNLKKVFGLGVFGGFITLSRAVFLNYLPFLVLSLFITDFLRRVWNLRKFICFLVGWAIPIACWTGYNWKTYHEFIPLTVQVGQIMFLALPSETETPEQRLIQEEKRMNEMGITRWIDQNRHLSKLSKEFIRAHPFSYAKYVAKKLFLFWQPWPNKPYPTKVQVMLGAINIPFFILAVLGIWFSRKQWLYLLPVYALFICLTITHALLYISLRYRVPLEPFLCAFAAVAVVRFFDRQRKA